MYVYKHKKRGSELLVTMKMLSGTTQPPEGQKK